MKKINKVLIDLSPLLNGSSNGGVKPFILKILSLLNKKNYIYHVILNDDYKERLHIEGLEFLKIRLSKVSYKFKILRFFDKYDYLFAPFGESRFHKFAKKKTYICYDFQHKYFPNFFAQSELTLRENRFKYYSKITNLTIICISEETKKDLIKFYDIGNSKVVVKPLYFSRLRENTIKVNKLNIGKKFFFYPANFWPHKNHEILIIAFNNFLKKNPNNDYVLVLTGDNLKTSSVQLLCKKLKIQNKVLMLGFVSTEEIKWLYENCYCLIFPSLFEGFGIPLVEAVSFGKPVVCSDLEIHKKILGSAAIYFNPKVPEDIFSKITLISLRNIYEEKLKHIMELQEDFKLNFKKFADDYEKIFY